MAERPAVNASPLIFLSKGNLLDLLKLANEEIVVPKPVVTEIRQRGAADPTVHAFEVTPWLVSVTPPPVPPIIQSWDLGPGESITVRGACDAQTETLVPCHSTARRSP